MIKGISLHQPWASAMALGLKKNETRHWTTSYRGSLLIHAAKRKPTKYEINIFFHILRNFGHPIYWLSRLPYGAILCKVNLIDCQQIGHENCLETNTLEYYLGNYDHDRFMWITDNLKVLKEPIVDHRGFLMFQMNWWKGIL